MTDQNEVEAVRQQLNIAKRKNIAIATFKIGQNQGKLIAVSGEKAIPGTVALPQQPLFDPEFPPGHLRPYDSEYKILEELARRYRTNSELQGMIKLFTERPPCSSCQFVIEQFRQYFPNIILEIQHGSL